MRIDHMLSSFRISKSIRPLALPHLLVSPAPLAAGQVNFTLLGAKYPFGSGDLILPLSRQVLEEKLLSQLTFAPGQVKLAQENDNEWALNVTGPNSVLVLRSREGDAKKFEVFVLFSEGLPLDLKKGLKCSLLEKAGTGNDDYQVEKLLIKRNALERVELKLTPELSFPLKQGDLILLPLGTPRDKNAGKNLIWLPLAYWETPAPQNDAQRLLESVLAGNHLEVRQNVIPFGRGLGLVQEEEFEMRAPHRMPEVTQMCIVMGARPDNLRPRIMDWIKDLRDQEIASLLDLVDDPKQKERIIGMASEAYDSKGAGQDKAKFLQLMALNYHLKQKAFQEITAANKYQQVEKVERFSNVAILAFTQHGSLIAFSPIMQGEAIRQSKLSAVFREAEKIYNALVGFEYLDREGNLKPKIFEGKEAFIRDFDPPFALDEASRGKIYDFLASFFIREIRYERIPEREDSELPSETAEGSGNIKQDIVKGQRIFSSAVFSHSSDVIMLATCAQVNVSEFRKASLEVREGFSSIHTVTSTVIGLRPKPIR